jgi:hypothetical protein
VVIEIAGNWELSTRATITGQLVQISPSGTTTTITQNPIANASIWGVAGTATAKSSMKREFKVRWIGSGAPEEYAYVKLLSSVSYWNTPNTGASVVVGLPPVQAAGDPDEVASIVAAGRKIAKITVGTDGTAFFNVDNSITATATAPISLVPVTNEGVLNSSGTLILKALGLYYDSNYRREDVTPFGANVYPWPAGGDDFENQLAETGLKLTYHWENVNPIFPLGPPIPTQVLDGGKYELPVGVEYKGSWSYFLQSESDSQPGQRNMQTGLTGAISSLDMFNSYGLADLEEMRKTPKIVTLTASTKDLAQVPTGPFTGKLKLSVWAPERIMNKSEYNVITKSRAKLVNGLDYAEVPGGLPQPDVLGLHSSVSKELSAEVSVTLGGTLGFDDVGVKADCGFKLGYKHVYSLGGIWNHPVQPAVLTTYWFEITQKDTHMARLLAKYGEKGYENDFGNTILNSSAPLRKGAWKDMVGQVF